MLVIESIVCKLRGERSDEQSDATELDLRMVWNAIVDNSVKPFADAAESLQWDKKELSFFHIENNRLVTADLEAMEALANLKELSERDGPCHQAFIIGGEGHWITIIYEKNEENRVMWYGIDSDGNKINQIQRQRQDTYRCDG